MNPDLTPEEYEALPDVADLAEALQKAEDEEIADIMSGRRIRQTSSPLRLFFITVRPRTNKAKNKGIAN